MRQKQIAKIVTDILMTVILLLLMAYSMVGEAAHEWLGIGMLMLFILHHVFNSRWTRNLRKGKYTLFRVLQTALVVLAMLSMLVSMVSGIVLSRYALSFLPITGGRSWARTLHMLSSYWGFVFISLHLGLHWSMMIGMAKRLFKNPSAVRRWIARGLGFLIAAYGLFVFFKREIGSYMFLKTQFVFVDFNEPLVLFLLDYIAVMGMFVFFGHYLAETAKKLSRNTRLSRLPE